MSPLLSLLLTTSCCLLPSVHSFAARPFLARPTTSIITPSSSSTTLHLKKGGKFGKQKDLAAKMEAAKRQRQQATTTAPEDIRRDEDTEPSLSPEETKLRNDRKRFESLLESSITSHRNDDYLTSAQEEENAEASYRGVARLYEGDPAPSSPFAELRSITNGESVGRSGVLRYVPWENPSKSSEDYIVVLSDPRPKSVELRSAVRNLLTNNSLDDAVSNEVLERMIVINPDSPGENRKHLKKYPADRADKLTILIDEDLEWMREYTALGEKRFGMTLFVLSGGVCRRIAREVDGDLICGVVRNAVRGL